tara:strand:- start:1410 stop:2696 length:1287 start_codon:yes stop_codon:yes gene_type:complete
MSLFEKLNNKRYDLQEKKINKKLSSNSGGDKKIGTVKPGEIEATKNVIRDKAQQPDLTPSGQKRLAQVDKKIQITDKTVKDFKKNLKNLAKGNTDPNKATMVKGTTDTDLIKGTKATGDEGSFRRNARKTKVTGDVIPKKDLPKTQGVNQADVSKDAKKFTNKINKQRIEKQGNIFGGQDKIETKRRVGSTTSRGTRNIKKKIITPGQQKLDLGGDITKKTPTPRLSKSGEIVTDLRTTGRKPRTARKRPSYTKPPKPEKMVVAPDPVKGGFKKVGATTKQGREVLKKSVSADELLGDKKISKTVKKPSLFTRTKNALKGFHKFMVKDANYRKTSGSGKMLPDTLGVLAKDKNISRNIFKNTVRGNTLRTINKFLPGKYKALAAIATGTYLATRPKKGAAGGGKGKIKRYVAYEKPLGFDTGKKKGEK